tara:strand:- start:352 stop:564 length:213 start_codon:yes stop_codon:yes gene_type:complete
MENSTKLIKDLAGSGLTQTYINMILAAVEREKDEAKEDARRKILTAISKVKEEDLKVCYPLYLKIKDLKL